MRAGRRWGAEEAQGLGAYVLSLPNAGKSKTGLHLKPGSTSSWLRGLRQDNSELYLMILSTAKVILCMKNTHPQAQSRCSERSALAHGEHLSTFPTSIPLAGKSAANKPVTWPHPSRRPAGSSYSGNGESPATPACLAAQAGSKGTARSCPSAPSTQNNGF